MANDKVSQIKWHKILHRNNTPLFQWLITKSLDEVPETYKIEASLQHQQYICGDIFMDLNELTTNRQNIEDQLLVEPKYPEKMYRKIKESGNEVLKFGQNLENKEFEKVSNKKLIQILNSFIKICLPFCCFFRFSFPAGEVFERRSKYIFRHLLKQQGQLNKFEPIFESLVIPFEKPDLSAEKEGLAQITLVKKQGKDINKLIKKFIKRFGYLSFAAGIGKVMSQKEILENIRKLEKKSNKNLNSMANWHQEQKNKYKKVLGKLKAPNVLKKNVDRMQRFIFSRLYIKEIYERLYFLSLPFFEEIGKRLSLTPIEVFYLIPEEIVSGLKGKKANLKNLSLSRQQYFAISRIFDKMWIITEPKQMKRLRQETEKALPTLLAEIKGQVANRGFVEGEVKVVITPKEMAKMKEGDILVTTMTTPEFVPILKLAKAIVTDEGGITCHAAIVSRELGIPCVIGTKIATKVLKDGGRVQVDANKGIIKKLR